MSSQKTPRLVELTTAPNEAQAGIIQSVLTDAGIPSWMQKAPGIDYFGLGTFGFAITTVTVRAEDVERARAALDTNRQDSVDLDWSEVNIGEPEDESSASIAERQTDSSSRARIPMREYLPVVPMLGWITVLALSPRLLTPWAPLLLFPIALADLIRRVRALRRAAAARRDPARLCA